MSKKEYKWVFARQAIANFGKMLFGVCFVALNFKALKALKFRHFAKQKRGLGFVLLQNKNPNGFSCCADKQIPSVAKAKIRLLLLKFKHGVDNVCYTKCHDSPQHPA